MVKHDAGSARRARTSETGSAGTRLRLSGAQAVLLLAPFERFLATFDVVEDEVPSVAFRAMICPASAETSTFAGCSAGIGRATAATLTAAGYEVVATARRSEDLQGIGAAMALPLDVTDEASMTAAVGAVLERYGRIEVLVNNAGYALRGSVEELEIAAVQRMFDVNVHGIIRLVRAVAPSMRARGSGRIVNISSVAGRITAPANGAYAATLDQRHFRAVRPTHLDALDDRVRACRVERENP